MHRTHPRPRALAPSVPLALIASAWLAGCPPTISEPRSEEHVTALAEADRHWHHGRVEEAEAALERAAETAERRVDEDEANYRHARLLMRADRWDEAVELLDAIADRTPPSRRTARAMYDAALLRHEHLGQTDAAMDGFDRVIREHPDAGFSGRAVYFRIRTFDDDPEGAIAWCDEMYEVVGTTTAGDDLLYFKAQILAAEARRDEARATYEQLVRDHPYPFGHRWDEAINRLADMDIEDGNPADAAERLEEMISFDDSSTITGSYTRPAFPVAALRIARIYRDELDDPDAADEAYEEMIDHYDRSILRDDAIYERGAMWLDRGEVERGCGFLRQVLEEYEVGRSYRAAAARVAADCPED